MQSISESKKRIHEQSYAQVVSRTITPDKSHIKLNQSLFNANIMAKQSCSLIKDVHKDVQSTIKKYDEFLKLTQTPQKIPDSITSSTSIMKPHQNEETQQFKDNDQSLLNQNPKYANSQELRKQCLPLERSELKLSNFKVKEELFPVEDISPIKQRNQSQILTSPPPNQSQYYGSYAKIHLRKSPTSPKVELQQQEKPQSPPPDIAKRNQEWKQRLQEKINQEKQRKSENEMKDCTFQPKLRETKLNQISKRKVRQQSSKNIDNSQNHEIKEMINVITELNQFSKQLKRKI